MDLLSFIWSHEINSSEAGVLKNQWMPAGEWRAAGSELLYAQNRAKFTALLDFIKQQRHLQPFDSRFMLRDSLRDSFPLHFSLSREDESVKKETLIRLWKGVVIKMNVKIPGDVLSHFSASEVINSEKSEVLLDAGWQFYCSEGLVCKSKAGALINRKVLNRIEVCFRKTSHIAEANNQPTLSPFTCSNCV